MLTIRKIAIVILTSLFILASIPSCQSVPPEESYSKGIFDFTRQSKKLSGSATITKEGAKFDTNAQSIDLKCSDDIKYNLTGNGKLTIELKNTSNLEQLKLGFITEEDKNWTNFKAVMLNIRKSDSFKTYTLDLSGQYGWLGTLCGISISAPAMESGELIIKSIKIAKGGEKYPSLNIGPEEILNTYRDRAQKGIATAPDGILGQWRNDDGSINFIGSNMGKIFKSTGTALDPFEQVHFYNRLIDNVPAGIYRYSSLAQVYKDPESGLLIGITHLEKDLDIASKSYAATLGLSVSTDNGDFWTFLGEIITHHIPENERPTVSRDIGNGTSLIKDGYLYIYSCEMDINAAMGLSVSRALLKDVFIKAKEGKVPEFKKYYNGAWNEPGLGGKFSNVLASGASPNFSYIQYNTVINKYIMVMCEAPYYKFNDGDIVLYLSDDLLSFKEKYYIACGKRGEQYPTMISLEPDSQTSSGNEFYIYYCSWDAYDQNGVFDWQKLWGTSNYIRRKVTVQPLSN